jgi:hypothetical protein
LAVIGSRDPTRSTRLAVRRALRVNAFVWDDNLKMFFQVDDELYPGQKVQAQVIDKVKRRVKRIQQKVLFTKESYHLLMNRKKVVHGAKAVKGEEPKGGSQLCCRKSEELRPGDDLR